MEYTVRIRDFGKDRFYSGKDAVETVQRVLGKEYRGKHVTIEYRMASGILACVYVSVSDQGVILNSYTGSFIDFEEINSNVIDLDAIQ